MAPPLSQTFAAAGVAAACELSLMQPLDVVKTRLHLRGPADVRSDSFRGTFGALRSISGREGVSGLWRGFGAGLVVVVPRRGFKFAANGFFQERLGGTAAPSRRGADLVAGGLAGALEACLITPFEVCKVALQSARTPRGSPAATLGDVGRAVYRARGAAGFSQGGKRVMFSHLSRGS